MSTTLPPPIIDLTPDFTVLSYNGSVQYDDDSENIRNLFNKLPRDRKHCSQNGTNYDLIIKYNNNDSDCIVTHLLIRGLIGSDNNIKNGLLWISNIEPSLSEYSVKYNNYTIDQYNDLISNNNDFNDPKIPILYFETDPITFQSITEFKPYRTDIGTFGIIGNVSSNISIDKLEKLRNIDIPINMDLKLHIFNPLIVNPFHSDLLMNIDSHYNCILFSNDSNLLLKLTEAMKFKFDISDSKKELNYFYTIEPIDEIFCKAGEELFPGAISHCVNITKECLSIIHISDTNMDTYVLDCYDIAEVASDDIIKFIQSFYRNEIPLHN